MKTLKLSLFFILTAVRCFSQRQTLLGVTCGFSRFYPEAKQLGTSNNNSMANGLGWSAGLCIQENWKPKLKQVIELNFYSLTSNISLQKSTDGYYGYNPSNPPVIIRNFSNYHFNQLALSAGLKYMFNKTLFAYPAIEVARSLNKQVDINKTTYNARLGLGVSARVLDVVLEYSYGLKTQRTVYDATVPFAGTHRNNFLQLKIQVPVYTLSTLQLQLKSIRKKF